MSSIKVCLLFNLSESQRNLMLKRLLAVFLVLFLVAAVPYVRAETNPRDTVLLIKSKTGTLGSGVVFAPGKMVTAAHVAEVTEYVVYKGYKVPFTILFIDKRQDIAIIEVVGIECPCSPLSFDTPKVDEPVIKYGYALYPTTLMLNRTDGRFQGIITMEEGQQWMLVTTPAAPGDSGGGVFVKHGNRYLLVGILSALAATDQTGVDVLVYHLALAIPISMLPKEYNANF